MLCGALSPAELHPCPGSMLTVWTGQEGASIGETGTFIHFRQFSNTSPKVKYIARPRNSTSGIYFVVRVTLDGD